MAFKEPFTPEVLNEILDYEQSSGLLFWRKREAKWFSTEASANAWNAKHAGKRVAESKYGRGYSFVYIMGKKMMAHRVIWAMVRGKWPSGVIDHIDRNPRNNRISNLRDVTQSENLQNQSKRKSESGETGVSWDQRRSRWVARIGSDKKGIFLGHFRLKADAINARKMAEQKFWTSPKDTSHD